MRAPLCHNIVGDRAMDAGGRKVACAVQYQDRYGRASARCGTAEAPDLGRALVRAGWALDWPCNSSGAYADAQRVAEAEGAGMHAGSFDGPWQWRRRP